MSEHSDKNKYSSDPSLKNSINSFKINPLPQFIIRIKDLHIVEANKKFINILGHKKGEIIGRTPIELRMFNDEVLALFPNIQADMNGNCQSYLHVGQHGAANYNYCIENSRAATPKEFTPLFRELVDDVGYDALHVFEVA